jgi:tetratricopeptide (TPR) repeat protein
MVWEVHVKLPLLISTALIFGLVVNLTLGQSSPPGIPLGGGGPPPGSMPISQDDPADSSLNAGSASPSYSAPDLNSDPNSNPNSDPKLDGDLLSKYDKPATSRPAWMGKLLGLLGAGGKPAKQAEKAYAEGDYDKSLQKYAEAQLDQPESQALAYNIGNAHFRKKKYEDAIKAYKKALTGSDAGLAAKAYYNLGNAEFRKGEFAIQSGQQAGIEDYREAMAHYKKSLELTPENKDAKRNIEVVQARSG